MPESGSWCERWLISREPSAGSSLLASRTSSSPGLTAGAPSVYLGSTVAMLGVAVITRSLVGLAAMLLVFVPVELNRARLEERALRARFGESWSEYASRVGFFLPKFAKVGRRR